jgi:hypothetical protein
VLFGFAVLFEDHIPVQCRERRGIGGRGCYRKMLHDELGLFPWQWPAFEYPDALCPYPDGCEAAKQWQRKRDENAWVRSRRPKCCKLATNPRLRRAVAGKLRLD